MIAAILISGLLIFAGHAQADTIRDSSGLNGGGVPGYTQVPIDWSRIVNKPATATRWPTWAELRNANGLLPLSHINAPSGFPAAAHDHDGRYLRLTGGTLSGGLNVNGTLRVNSDLIVRNGGLDVRTPNNVGSIRINEGYPAGISTTLIWDENAEGWPTAHGDAITFNHSDSRAWQLFRSNASKTRNLLFYRSCTATMSDADCNRWFRLVHEDFSGDAEISGNLDVNGTLRVNSDLIVSNGGLDVRTPNKVGSIRINEGYPAGISTTLIWDQNAEGWPAAHGDAVTFNHHNSRAWQLFRSTEWETRNWLFYRNCSASISDADCNRWFRLVHEDFSGDAEISGNMRANNFISTSDLRLKEDITPIEGALDKLSRLNAVSFRWKGQDDDTVQIGLIAQEVQEEFPEAVHEDDKGYLSVSYSSLVAPLIASLKEVKSGLAMERERNDALERRLEELEKAIFDQSG